MLLGLHHRLHWGSLLCCPQGCSQDNFTQTVKLLIKQQGAAVVPILDLEKKSNA